MSIEGQIQIRLTRGEANPIAISSTRPREVTGLLRGLDPEALEGKLPLLYALCGKAHALAATRALGAAGAERAATAGQGRAAVSEALQEHLWRFLIDLPQRLQQPPAVAVLAPLRHGLAGIAGESWDSRAAGEALGALDRALQEDMLGMASARWQGLDPAERDGWLERSPARVPAGLRDLRDRLARWPAVEPAQALLPAAPSSPWLRRVAEAMGSRPGFAFEPDQPGKQPETGALSYQQEDPWLRTLRRQGHSPVLLRLVARLLELLRLKAWLATAPNEADPQSGSLLLAPGSGVGWVRTARGLLMHRVRLIGGVVEHYQILAPTEWNFHPRGPLFSGLTQWQAVPADQLSNWVGLQLLSLDPCVTCQFEVDYA